MYAIYGNIYHQYTPNVSIYTIHGSYGLYVFIWVDLILGEMFYSGIDALPTSGSQALARHHWCRLCLHRWIQGKCHDEGCSRVHRTKCHDMQVATQMSQHSLVLSHFCSFPKGSGPPQEGASLQGPFLQRGCAYCSKSCAYTAWNLKKHG